MPSVTLLVIDGSSIFRPNYIVAPATAVTATLDRIRALASDYPHAAVCWDSGRTFRNDIDANYKAQRPMTDDALRQLQAQVNDALRADGFPCWTAKGFEADDIIATAVRLALEQDDVDVHIASADKDLLVLVGDHVFIRSLMNGELLDAERVHERFDIYPGQMTDYLCLVGDSSDNVKGAKGIGPKKAATLLKTYGSLAACYTALDAGEAALPPDMLKSLGEFRERWPTVRNLITLRTDVDIPFAEIAAERTPPDAAPFAEEMLMEDTTIEEPAVLGAGAPPPPLMPEPIIAPSQAADFAASPPTQLVKTATPVVQDWDRQLEPRSMDEAKNLAVYMYQARLFSGYGTASAVLSTILLGRELGLNALASLRAIHIIDSKHSLAADAMRALVLRSGAAKYFRCTERTAERCTWETHRAGEPAPTALTFTIEQGKAAWSKDERAWKQSGWGRYPEDMLSARASSKLARLVYSDVLFSLYSPEELRDEVA